MTVEMHTDVIEMNAHGRKQSERSHIQAPTNSSESGMGDADEQQ